MTATCPKCDPHPYHVGPCDVVLVGRHFHAAQADGSYGTPQPVRCQCPEEPRS